MDRLFRTSSSDISKKDYSSSTISGQEDWVIGIDVAEYVAEYRLRLKFTDGKEVEVDFEPFLQSSLNPLIRRYLDKQLFKQFTVMHGDLFWHDYDLCFPIADLYEGCV